MKNTIHPPPPSKSRHSAPPWGLRSRLRRFFFSPLFPVILIIAILAGAWGYLTVRNGNLLKEELARFEATGALTSIEEVRALAQGAEADASGKVVVDFFMTLTPEDFSTADAGEVMDLWGTAQGMDSRNILDHWSPEYASDLRSIRDHNRALIGRISEIARLPPANRGTWIRSAMVDAKAMYQIKMPNFLAVRQAANLLVLEALLACDDGRPGDALHHAELILRLANHMSNSTRSLFSEFIAGELRNSAIDLTREVVQKGAPTEVALHALGTVLEESIPIEAASRALEWECLSMLDAFSAVQDGRLDPKEFESELGVMTRFYTNPLSASWRNQDRLCYLQVMNAYIAAAKLPYAAAKPALHQAEAQVRETSAYETPLAHIVLPNTTRTIKEFYAYRARVVCARTALGVLQYRQRADVYPGDLETLVPAYLAAAPSDPFTGAAVRYRHDTAGFNVYSVGENGIDEGGRGDDIGWEPTVPE